MCWSRSTLYYGVNLRTLTLCLAAKEWAQLAPVFEAVDLIALRKRRGTLQVQDGGGTVTKVPFEVWEAIKGELNRLVVEEVEDEVVRHMHENAASLGDDSAPPAPPDVFSMEHYWHCLVCRTDPQVNGKKHIRKFLKHFGLYVPTRRTLGPDDDGGALSETGLVPVTVFPASKAASDLPYFTLSIEIFHTQHGDAFQALAPLPPDFFALPRNAPARFKALLSSGLSVTTGSFESAGYWHPTEGPKPAEYTAKDIDGKVVSTDEPRWLLWASAVDHGRR
ncbi:hypothetical protein JCM10213_009292 [Rhodosporidiobolus nylandii]